MKNIKSIKSINLNEMERPLTMVIVHYKNKRLSIPLFHQCFNFTQYINTQIYKFQQTILKSQQQTMKNTTKQQIAKQQLIIRQQELNNIVCYKMYNHETNQLTKLKTNIVLSLIRDLSEQKINYQFDITQMFNYLEIQPYYGKNLPIIHSIHQQYNQQQQNHSIYAYQIVSILAKTINRNIYLGIRRIDGIYACIKIKRKNDKIKNIFSDGISTIIHKANKVNEEFVFRLTTFLQRYEQFQKYCPGGTLLQYWSQQGKKPLSQQQCLSYLKQLLLAAYNLHQYYGVIHRQILIQKIYVGLKGQLKLNQFNSMSTPRIIKPYGFKQYNKSKKISQKSPYYYFQEQHLQSEIYSIGPCTPPQLLNQKLEYNSLVDYYNIGLVIYELLNGRQYTPRDNNKNDHLNGSSLNVVLTAMLSHDLTIRGEIVAELLFSLFEQHYQPKYQNLINLSAIKVGNLNFKDQNQYHNKHHNDIISYYQLIRLVDNPKNQDIGKNYLNSAFKQKFKVIKDKQKKQSNSQSKASKNKSYKKFNDSLSKSKNIKDKSKSKNKSKTKSKSKSKSQNQNKYLQPKQSKNNCVNKSIKTSFYQTSPNQIYQSKSNNHLNFKANSNHLSPKQVNVINNIISHQIKRKSPIKFKQEIIRIKGSLKNQQCYQYN